MSNKKHFGSDTARVYTILSIIFFFFLIFALFKMDTPCFIQLRKTRNTQWDGRAHFTITAPSRWILIR